MRWHSKKKNVFLATLLLLAGLYFINLIADLKRSLEVTPKDLTWKAQRLVSQDSWVEQRDYLSLNVSFQLLAGAPSAKQKFLAIGISSVKRGRGSYLIPTLQSIFSQSSPEERSSLVVVVLLADFDVSWRISTVKEIRTVFPWELEQGHLVVIHVSEEWYPPLTGLKRNYNDAPDRVSFRSKQNIDYSFLIHYSAGFGEYYLQLEDDILSAKNFLTSIKKHIEEQNQKSSSWAMLEFSALGYIGKLYKSTDTPLLARFLFLFYQEMPCDWLMTHFREVMTQRETILFKPSLFQHMGTFSSFQGTFNKLKDKDFEESLYSNPPAEVYTDMSAYKNHLPLNAWEPGERFFWGRSPEKGNHMTVVFVRPAVVTGVLVETGSGGKDLLDSGQVEIGQDVVTTEKGKTCKEFRSLGAFKNGRFEMLDVDKKFSSASSCVRILVTAGQKDWIIIQKIRITTRQSTSPPPS
ncbi:Alpha-1,3-mannosyl-glycoprotein 4-beta-N-acetylglucosaminyltransferase C [Oryzias melastigma]|uniref:Alpha-1,3-mannosyl-glycoprotein 4-beta-N-acetylglucosaminyltransferase C n=1 Tax=Oryzias melastigma TaxID=30732 RepID=A0A834EVC6_ORYME|nr:Alpha-1,3-mannosyl-glycoprotein 4-beta-N-acetylglucosaminyltransferase C [Oryzias melastigma]